MWLDAVAFFQREFIRSQIENSEEEESKQNLTKMIKIKPWQVREQFLLSQTKVFTLFFWVRFGDSISSLLNIFILIKIIADL